jgi:integrase
MLANRERKQLPFLEWPPAIRGRWEAALVNGDFLDEDGPGAHLAPATRATLQSACGSFFQYLENETLSIDVDAPQNAIDPKVLAAFVEHRRKSCSDSAIAAELHHLRRALRLIFPEIDLRWLLDATKRIACQAKPRANKHHLMTSDRLYRLGLELMDTALQTAATNETISKDCAFQYRDGLIIFLLALIPLRRRTLTALQIGKHLVRSGSSWVLDIPEDDLKSAEPMEFVLSTTLCDRIDVYLEKFRSRIPGALTHNGLWVSNKGNPMDDGAIYDAVRRRTRAALGFGVNLHRFRHAALTFWSIHDPENIRGGKDLLGHRSFGTTEKYYIMAQSRMAGRVLANSWKERGSCEGQRKGKRLRVPHQTPRRKARRLSVA